MQSRRSSASMSNFKSSMKRTAVRVARARELYRLFEVYEESQSIHSFLNKHDRCQQQQFKASRKLRAARTGSQHNVRTNRKWKVWKLPEVGNLSNLTTLRGWLNSSPKIDVSCDDTPCGWGMVCCCFVCLCFSLSLCETAKSVWAARFIKVEWSFLSLYFRPRSH